MTSVRICSKLIVCSIHVHIPIQLGSIIFCEKYLISVKIDFIRLSTACSIKKKHVYVAFIFWNSGIYMVFFKEEFMLDKVVSCLQIK